MVGAEHGGQRLDVFLTAQAGGESRAPITRHIAGGAVEGGGGRVTAPSRKVRPGEIVVWTPPPVATTELVAEDLPLVIVHEDPYLVVVDKPAGMVVHPAAGHERGTLVNALLARLSDLRGIGGELRPGIVHRIDKDTSGLLVVAKDDATMIALAAAFKAHDVHRVYEALAVGRPPGPSGRIETPYGRDPHDRKKFSSRVREGKKAITGWSIVERLGDAVRLEARLETGRTHQVRVHMAALGLPLLGDAVYGRTPRDPAVREIGRTLGRQALHARELGFVHPRTGGRIELRSPPPPDFAAALEALRALARGGG